MAKAALALKTTHGSDEDTLDNMGKDDTPNVGGIAADRLRSLIERIERLEEERKALGSDIKDIYAEAKSAGFDVKVLRQIIRIRKQGAGRGRGAGDAAGRLSSRAGDVAGAVRRG